MLRSKTYRCVEIGHYFLCPQQHDVVPAMATSPCPQQYGAVSATTRRGVRNNAAPCPHWRERRVRNDTSRPPSNSSLPVDEKPLIPTGLVGLLLAYLPPTKRRSRATRAQPPLRQRGEPAPLAYGRQNPSASLVGAALRPQPQGGSHARRKPYRGTHRLHPSR